jgi:hypothetical protein
MTAQPFTTGSSRTGLDLLRWVLAADAAVTTANGLVYLLASGPVGRLLGVPAEVLLGVGAFLVVYGPAVGYLASRPLPSTAWVRTVIGANAAWVVVSLAVLASGRYDLTLAGAIWIPAQAVVVAAFALLQGIGLRRRADRRP